MWKDLGVEQTEREENAYSGLRPPKEVVSKRGLEDLREGCAQKEGIYGGICNRGVVHF